MLLNIDKSCVKFTLKLRLYGGAVKRELGCQGRGNSFLGRISHLHRDIRSRAGSHRFLPTRLVSLLIRLKRTHQSIKENKFRKLRFHPLILLASGPDNYIQEDRNGTGMISLRLSKTFFIPFSLGF